MSAPRVLRFLLVLLSLGASAHGAAITWGSPTTISADTDVSTSGTLDRAFNFGGASAPRAVTLNGVPFTFFGVDGSPSTTVGTTTLASSAGAVFGTTDNFGSSSAPFTGLSADYQRLAANGAFATSGTLTLTLSGLVVGQTYLFEWWVSDSRAAVGPHRQGTATAGNAVQLQFNAQGTEGGVGQFAIGTFTADATSEVISFSGQSDGVVGAAPQINAFELRVIPEPSTIALLLVGGALSILRRRRKS
jgi:hypothetical protein